MTDASWTRLAAAPQPTLRDLFAAEPDRVARFSLDEGGLRSQIRGCPAPMLLPEAGHFVQEHGAQIAREAVGYFRP